MVTGQVSNSGKWIAQVVEAKRTGSSWAGLASPLKRFHLANVSLLSEHANGYLKPELGVHHLLMIEHD